MKTKIQKIDFKAIKDKDLHSIVNGQWMITPNMLHTIHDIYNRHVNNERLDSAEISRIIGGSIEDNDHSFLITENGTAIIQIQGVIAQKINMLHDVSGGTSSELIQKQLREALNSTEVKSTVLNIHSPGGTVRGIFELADFIFESRNTKPIVAHSDGIMTSAAFLIGAATSKIITSGQLVEVGGIGVITEHEDISEQEKMLGKKVTVLHSGKFKAIGNPHAPLSLDDRMILQEKLDFMYTHFVTTVAKFRNVSVETVLSNMADGRTFMGNQAIKAGLVDEISTLDNLILGMPNQIKSSGNFNINNFKEVADMEIKSMEDLKKELPELVKTLSGEVSAEAVSNFKKSDEYVALEEIVAKANIESEQNTANTESATVAKLKSELEIANTKLSDLDNKLFAMQVARNTNKADNIFAHLVAETDHTEMVQNKILEKQPHPEKHLDDNKNLKVDSYTEACKKEVDSWAKIMDNTDQTIGLVDGKEIEGSETVKEVSAYSKADEGKW